MVTGFSSGLSNVCVPCRVLLGECELPAEELAFVIQLLTMYAICGWATLLVASRVCLGSGGIWGLVS
jgi:hypothetical protein